MLRNHKNMEMLGNLYLFCDAELVEVCSYGFAFKYFNNRLGRVPEEAALLVAELEDEWEGLIGRRTMRSMLDSASGQVRKQLKAQTSAPQGKVLL
jgi:hypothetical protein